MHRTIFLSFIYQGER
jgi:hypothetical protein